MATEVLWELSKPQHGHLFDAHRTEGSMDNDGETLGAIDLIQMTRSTWRARTHQTMVTFARWVVLDSSDAPTETTMWIIVR